MSILLTKSYATASCTTDKCDCEESEIEKLVDDQQLIPSVNVLTHNPTLVLLKATFSFSEQSEYEIFKNLLYPPPELV